MKDPESITWDEWAAFFHRSLKCFIEDAAGQPADSPMGRLREQLRAATEEYELALATQDTERSEPPA